MTTVYCTACGETMHAVSAACSRCGTPNHSRSTLPVPASGVVSSPGFPLHPLGAQASPPMAFGEAIGSFFRNYANFDGRARRSEFWFAWLFVSLISFGIQLTSFYPSVEVGLFGAVVYIMWALAVLVPSLAVASRRLHDTDTSFGYYFLILVPLVGVILVIIKLATDGTPGPNRFGDSVKHIA